MKKAIRKHPILTAFAALSIALFVFAVYVFKSSSGSSGGVPLSLGDKIAIVEINGVILDSKKTIEHIESARKNQSIKGVVIRVNSPGGGVAPSQEIYGEIKRLAKVKKVVASLSSLAASGGYYVACGAEKIVANPGTLTGSIGVIMDFSNIEELLKKVGLKNYVIKSGRYKDVGSPAREMTVDERKLLQALVDNVHGQFVNAVADGRKMAKEDVKKIADGRVLTGEQALASGLVDELGTLQDSIRLVSGMAGIEGEPRVVYLEGKKGIFEYLKNKVPFGLLGDFASPRLMYMTDFY